MVDELGVWGLEGEAACAARCPASIAPTAACRCMTCVQLSLDHSRQGLLVGDVEHGCSKLQRRKL